MPDTPGLSEARRALLQRYLRGELPQSARAAGVVTQRAMESQAPLSFGQQQMWLLEQLTPASPVYSECVTIHLPGPLDIAALEQSFNEIIGRHEAWRTSFPIVDGQPIQMIHPPSTLALPVVDLRHLPEAEREAEALRLATEDARILFDLARHPLLRATLIQLSDVEHRLFLTLHQSIFDGVSLYQVFLPELRALYEAFSSGKPSPLPDLPIQYADFAVWQRQWLQGGMLADRLAYWKQRLAGAPAALELPTDRPRPPVQSYRGAMRPFALSRRLTDAIKALSRQEGVTMFMALLAAFSTLLYRYTGQDDILIGTPTAGRKHLEIQGLMGYFLNTLVLRTDLSGDPTFRELLVRAREVISSAFAHEDVPFEYLVKELRAERNLGHNALYQVMLILEPSLPVLPSGWTLTQMDVETDTAKLDLTLELDDRPEGLVGRFEYSTDLFDAATIDRMVEHWQTLLESIVADPGQRLSELQLLAEAERHQLLVEWNATSAEYPRSTCIHQLFEAQVERTPDAVAVVYEHAQLTYRELNRRANQLAHYLQRLGVRPEMLVGLCVERSLEMIVGVLGILKAGGAYVPLDSAYPRERLSFMLQDTQTPILVTQERLREGLPEHGARVVRLDTDRNTLAQESAENPVSEVAADNLAYVIYTSGSTGRPKGVLVTQRNLVNSTCTRMTYYRVPVSGFLLLSSFAFDSSAAGIFWTLCQGGMLVLPQQGCEQDPSQTAEVIARCRTSHILSTPSLYSLLLTRATSQQLMSLRAVIVAGEPCPGYLPGRHYELLPHTSLFNEYGPTEATVWSSAYEFPSQGPGATVSIGRPIVNTQIYLLDRYLHPVPIGVPGELCIGGVGLARGYLNRPELTAEKFIAHPFSNEPGARLYKTGDLARYLPTGDIVLLGRLDHQVKLRGYRVELGEIEAVLRQHQDVREVVVAAREHVTGDKRLVAYVVPRGEHAPMSSELRRMALERLPDYMVPSAFVLLESLPLTPGGKLDRRALPAPDQTRREVDETFVAPTLAEHQHLIQIWEELLDARPIGIRDNFFDLGGHSLLAARLVDWIEQVWGKKIPLATLLAGPTIEQLADTLVPSEAAASGTLPGAVRAGGSRLTRSSVPRVAQRDAHSRRIGSKPPFVDVAPSAMRSDLHDTFSKQTTKPK
jgi:surfactin family lipopeptide synthetase A